MRPVELEPTKFVRFLSDLWTQWNWQMNAQLRGEGRYLVQDQRGDGAKGLMFMLPTVEMTVETEHIKGFVAHAKKRGVDIVVVAMQGEFADAVCGLATNYDTTLFDHDELGETVADEGLEQTVKQYTDGDVFKTVGVEFGLPFDPPEPVEDALASLPIAAVRERLVELIDGRGDAGGGDGDSDNNSNDGGGNDSSAGSFHGKLPLSVDDLKSGLPPGVHVVVVAVLLLVLALGFVAALGPMPDGLGGSSGGGSGGDHGVSVSALSSASADSADAIVRWNARITDTSRVGNQTCASPEGERFVVAGFNATATGDSPGSLSQSALVFESNGIRHGHRPLPNATDFDNDRLFAPGDDVHVWTVFIVSTNATTGTVLVQSTNEDAMAFVHNDVVSTDPNGGD